MPSRWDFLYDRKPVPLVDHLIEEVAKKLAQDLSGWPPPVEGWESDEAKIRFAPLFEPGAERPPLSVLRCALKLVRWDLERDLEAVDEHMRNERWREQVKTDGEYLAMVFLWRWAEDQLLSLSELTEGRVKRSHLVRCVERLEHLLALA